MAWSGYSEQGSGSQERGPNTFAVDVPGAPAARPVYGEAASEARGGIRYIGQGTGSLGQIAPADPRAPDAVSVKDDTFNILMNLAQATLAPKIAELKMEATVRGALRHASGVALEEIVNEQPWYANVFGTAPAVEGARVWGAQSAVARFTQDAMNNMEQLSTQPPEALLPLLTDRIKQHMTGDPATDAVIQGALLEAVPPLVKAHTKGHVAYMQTKADSAHRGAMTASAEGYAQAMQSELLTPDDRALAEMNLAKTFMLPEGRNPETHFKNVTDVIVEQATKGNTHFIAAATKAGMLGVLPDEQRDLVKKALIKAAPVVFSKMVTDDLNLLTAITALKTHPPEGADAVKLMYDNINDVAVAKTGIPKELVSLLDTDDLLKALGFDMRRAVDSAERAQSAVARSILKEREELQKAHTENLNMTMFTTAIQQDLNDPSVNAVLKSKGAARTFGLSEAQAAEGWRAVLNSKPAAEIGTMLTRTPIETNSAIKERLQMWYSAANNPQSSEAWQAGWGQLIEMAQALPGGPAGEEILATHMGDQDAARTVMHAATLSRQADRLTAITMAQTEAPARRAAAKWQAGADDEKREKANKIVADAVKETIAVTQSSRLERTFTGGREANQYQIDVISGFIAGLDTGQLSTPEASIKVGFRAMQNSGELTVAGGGLVLNLSSIDARNYPLHKAAGFNSIGMEDALHDALFIRAEKELAARTGTGKPGESQFSWSGITSGKPSPDYLVTRLPRGANDKRIQYSVQYSQDGLAKSIIIDSDMVKETYEEIVGRNKKLPGFGGPQPDTYGEGTGSLIAP